MMSQKKNDAVTTATKYKDNSDKLTINHKNGETNFTPWDKGLYLRSRLHFPNTHGEIYREVPVETREERLVRQTQDIQEIPLIPLVAQNVVLDEATYQLIAALPAAQRTRATELAKEQAATRVAERNSQINTINSIRAAERNERVRMEIKKEAERGQLASWLLSEEVMSAEVAMKIKAAGDYDMTPGAFNSAYKIRQIALREFGDVRGDVLSVRLKLKKQLDNMKQDNQDFYLHTTLYRDHVNRCVAAGVLINEEELVHQFVVGLNLQIFRRYISEYTNNHAIVGATLNEAINHATTWFQNEINIDPDLIKNLHNNSNKSFIAYELEEDHKSNEIYCMPTSALSSTSALSKHITCTCQLCGKENHEASTCWKISDKKFMDKFITDATQTLENDEAYKNFIKRITALKKSRRNNDDQISQSKKRKKEINIDCLIASPEIAISYETCATLLDSTTNCKYIDIEHDDHAEKHVITESAAMLFTSLTSCQGQSVRGVVPGVIAPVLQKGQLQKDMGEGIIIQNASRNLASGPELAKSYEIIKHDNHELIYQHRENKSRLIFRKDRMRFNDDFYHMLIETSDTICIDSLDFYNPKPLVPVPLKGAEKIWELIYAVEALHWAKNHASTSDMVRTISDPAYQGPVTTDAINLFEKHRGCAACIHANMKSHSQIKSSRERSNVVGEVVQGDIFYIEDGIRPIPVLLLICEASMFIYFYVFTTSAARAKPNAKRIMVTIPEIEIAFSQALVLWTHADRTMKTIRFDRESAVATVEVKQMLLTRGVDVQLTAAGQKLALIEVTGRIVKDRGRATIAGILHRFGYAYPERFYPRLFGEITKILNRSHRQGESLSPLQKFFTPEHTIDIRRDLNTSIGEVLLFKRPKKGVVSPIGMFRAEWGIVISRSFNATGVVEVYLPESKKYAHRFKFDRTPVPPYIMELVRNTSASSEPATIEDPNITKAALAEDGIEWMPTSDIASIPNVTTLPNTIEDLPTIELPVVPSQPEETVEAMSAQLRYKKAIREYPDRAQAAMKEELQAMLDKEVWRGILYEDIPQDERDLILRSMDGFKEKIRPTGEWEKDKARVFVDGSVQKPEHTGEHSSPVARIESIFAMTGIAAYLGWIVVKVDVTSAFLTTPRPPEVKYKYLRLSRELSTALVQLDPTYGPFVDHKGCVIVVLDKMLYGMKESGYEFYKNLMSMLKKGGFEVNAADPCVVHRISDNGQIHGGLIVDDGLYIMSSNEQFDLLISMYTDKFGPPNKGFTFTRSDTIHILGMLCEFDRLLNRVLISQPALAQALVKEVGVTKYSRLPAAPNLFEVPVDSPLLSEQDSEKYRSWNQSLMYLATRTYPECLPAATVGACRFHLATEKDLDNLRVAISYLGSDPEHCLVIRPGSLSLVVSADASYGVHADGKSHGGDCMGFKGCGDIPDAYFTFSSGKQSIVTKSSCESELVQANKGADWLLWGSTLLEGFGIKSKVPYSLYRNEDKSPYAHEDISTPLIYQDNTSTMHLIEHGRGNFKTTKHIRVRYYFIRDLVLAGEMVVTWLSTREMVADMLSKGVVWAVFCYLLPMLIGKR